MTVLLASIQLFFSIPGISYNLGTVESYFTFERLVLVNQTRKYYVITFLISFFQIISYCKRLSSLIIKSTGPETRLCRFKS